MYRAWDRTDGTGARDGASDWAELQERMNYIVNLFRSRQQDPCLAAHRSPTNSSTAMQAGQVPTARCLPPAA